MQIQDPRLPPQPWYARWVLPALSDSRDACLVGLVVRCSLVVISGAALLCAPVPAWPLVALWFVLLASSFDRFTLMLHCTSHRPLWRGRQRWLNQLIPCVIGPFFGQSPHSYFIHHMGMHHVEQNLAADLSSTLRYRRDRLDHFVRYWARFMLVGLPELAGYLGRSGRAKLRRRLMWSECSYLA